MFPACVRISVYVGVCEYGYLYVQVCVCVHWCVQFCVSVYTCIFAYSLTHETSLVMMESNFIEKVLCVSLCICQILYAVSYPSACPPNSLGQNDTKLQQLNGFQVFVEGKVFFCQKMLWNKPKECDRGRWWGDHCGKSRFLRGRKGWPRVCVPSLRWAAGDCTLNGQVTYCVLSVWCLILICIVCYHFLLHLCLTLAQLTLALELGLDCICREILTCSVLLVISKSSRSHIAMLWYENGTLSLHPT